VTEVILGGGGVAGCGKHSEILMLPTKKEITEKEVGQRINVSPAVTRLRSLFRTPPASPCSKQVCKPFPKHRGKKNPDLVLTSTNE